MEWSPPPPETPKRIDKTPNKHLPWFCHHPTISFSLSSLPLGLFLSYKTAPCTVKKIKEEEESKAPENSTDSTTHQTLYTNSVKSGGIQVTKQKVWEQLLWFCGGLWSFFYIHRNAITLHFGNQLKSHFSLFFFFPFSFGIFHHLVISFLSLVPEILIWLKVLLFWGCVLGRTVCLGNTHVVRTDPLHPFDV